MLNKILIAVTALLLPLSASAQDMKGTSVTKGGLKYRMIVDKPGGKKPEIGDYVKMHLSYTVDDSVLYSSRQLNNNEPVEFQLMKPNFNGDITEGFMQMTAGDSAILYVPTDSLIAQGTPVLPWMKRGSGQHIVYRIVMVDVKSMEQMKRYRDEMTKQQKLIDDKKLKEYFKKNNINARKTESGLYYSIERDGTGALPKQKENVSVNYTGRTLDGKVFDSNVDPKFMHVEPFKFMLGAGQVIKGWDIGVALFKKGTKGTLYIPSGLAYGPNSPDPNKIPANGVLIFDIEVLKK